jgi:hypothetical protein
LRSVAAPGRSRAPTPADTGWLVGNQPPGFKKIMEMKRFKPGAEAVRVSSASASSRAAIATHRPSADAYTPCGDISGSRLPLRSATRPVAR